MTGKTPKKKERPGVDRMGRTPLHYAALDGKIAQAKGLLAKGADPSARDDNGWTPLHFAVQDKRLPMMKLLLSSGAEVDARDSNGNTSLLNAVFQYAGDDTFVAVLIAHGADPKCKNEHGVSPLSLAKSSGDADVVKYLRDHPVRRR